MVQNLAINSMGIGTCAWGCQNGVYKRKKGYFEHDISDMNIEYYIKCRHHIPYWVFNTRSSVGIIFHTRVGMGTDVHYSIQLHAQVH